MSRASLYRQLQPVEFIHVSTSKVQMLRYGTKDLRVPNKTSILLATRVRSRYVPRLGGFLMAPELLPDGLWKLIEPFVSADKAKHQCGRPRLPQRACLTGIVFLLRSGIPWEMQRTGLRFRHDLLASSARLARGRSLATYL